MLGTLLSLFSLLSSTVKSFRERTFIIVKPDAIQRALLGKIISRFEHRGYKLVAMRFLQANDSILQKHYADLSTKPFFQSLVKYMKMGPVVIMVWEGKDVVLTARDMIGATDPLKSNPGTIRGDFGISVGRNVIHGSDSVDSADREIGLWFKNSEVIAWQPSCDAWIFEEN